MKPSSPPPRYLDNIFADYKPGYQSKTPAILSEEMTPVFLATLEDYEAQHPPTMAERVKSHGPCREDPSFYTGSGGCAYVYWRVARYFAKQGDVSREAKYAEYAKTSVKVSLELHAKRKERQGCASFFMSKAGPLALGYILDLEQKAIYLEELLKLGERQCFGKEAEDQLLYGNAGYLYALLLVYKASSQKSEQKSLESMIGKVIKALVERGISKEAKFLMYSFPREGGKPYLGGAHGLAGIMYMILRAVALVPDGPRKFMKRDWISRIGETASFILQIQMKSGNFPSSLGRKEDTLVHFCHGAPGFVSLFCEAFALLQEPALQAAALKAGECIWKRGILTKGNGVCHGITGNAYALHRLSQICKGPSHEKWKFRALLFTQLTYDKAIQAQLAEISTPGRSVKGVPDSPLSLMEGLGGTVCLYADLLGDEMQLPGFEV